VHGAVLTVSDAQSGYVGVVDIAGSGTKIDIIGAGYQGGETVSIVMGGESLTSVSASDSGAISAMGLDLPSSVSDGDVVSIVGNGSSGTVGWGVLLITDKSTLN
jgi:hypothetical protein